MHSIRTQFNKRKKWHFLLGFVISTSNVTDLHPECVAKPLLLDCLLSELMWGFSANLRSNLSIFHASTSPHSELAVLELVRLLVQGLSEGHSGSVSIRHTKMCHR